MKSLYFLFFFSMSQVMFPQLVINEVLIDPPPTIVGDANGDGTRNTTEDAFIELVNNSVSPLDISGYQIFDNTVNVRHVVPISTVIPANGVYVVFGGGTPTGSFNGAIVHTASTGTLHLTASDDVITVKDNLNNDIIVFDTAALNLNMANDQSAERNPSITGNFKHHYAINETYYSPGTLSTSTLFNTSPLILNEIFMDAAGFDANGDGSADPSDDEFIELVNTSGSPLDLSGYKFYNYISYEAAAPDHIVPASTIIPAGAAYVIFGGGTPTGSFGGSTVQVCSDDKFSFINNGDTVYIEDSFGTVVRVFDSPETGVNMNSNQSATRDPDISGNFVLHTTTTGGLDYSPGTQSDGSVLSTNSFNKMELAIYPNPVNNGVVNIKTPFSGEKKIELFDITGKYIFSKDIYNELDVTSLNSGFYLLKISVNDQFVVKKLIIH